MSTYTLQIMSHNGHDVYEYDDKNIDEIVEMVLEKIEEGWILYGKENESDRDMKVVISANEITSDREVKKRMNKVKYAMMDNAASNEEPLRFKKKILAPPVRGG